MNNIFIALCIGIIAGIIDVVTMIIQNLDEFSCISAFIHWIVINAIRLCIFMLINLSEFLI